MQQQTPAEPTLTPKQQNLARAFWRMGWLGFWLQLVFGSLPILGAAYYFTFARPDPEAQGGFGVLEFLTIINVVLLVFTTYWSFGYTRIGRRLRDPLRLPSESSMSKAVWTGVIATTAGMFCSLIAIVIETANLLFYFLKSPQAGFPVIQTSGTSSAQWVSAFDMMSLTALVLFLFAEQIVLMLGLWLLYRITPRIASVPAVADPEADKDAAEQEKEKVG